MPVKRFGDGGYGRIEIWPKLGCKDGALVQFRLPNYARHSCRSFHFEATLPSES
jgi:hypothetical protein